MLKIEVSTFEDGRPYREQVVDALAAIGFAPSSAVVSPIQPNDLALARGATAEEAANPEPAKRGGHPRKDKADEAPAPVKEPEAPKAADPAPQISANPENRVEPTAESSSEDDNLFGDAPAEKLTHDDIRKVSGEYINKFGVPAAKEDLRPCLQGYPNISAIPDDQAEIRKVYDAFKKMVDTNPHNHPLQKKD